MQHALLAMDALISRFQPPHITIISFSRYFSTAFQGLNAVIYML